MKVFFEKDSPLEDSYWEMKGYRAGVLIEIDGNYYDVEFLTMDRFLGECRIAKEHNEHYVIDVLTVFVDDVSKDSIIAAIRQLDSSVFYTQKPVDTMIRYCISLQEMREQWVEVFSDSD